MNKKERLKKLYMVFSSQVDFLMETNKIDNKLTEGKIKEALDNFFQEESPKFSLDQNDYTYLLKEALSHFPVYEEKGVSIKGSNKRDNEWFSSSNDINHVFLDRYRQYLLENGMSQQVVSTLINKDLPEITNLIGNPKEENFSIKGLVIGDVQSGKTANYIGLMCNAADAGYKIILLLSGITENLRRQTQIRVEEGFIGFDGENRKAVGVGKNSRSLDVSSLTTRDCDFVKTQSNTMLLRSAYSSSGMSNKCVFIAKKNVHVLKTIYSYLKEDIPPEIFDKTGTRVRSSLLLIDDEADNASINTNDEDYDPTETNKWIRNILDLFTKSTYVGYTATPFANVFILPNSEEDMKNEDLFPKDFIYALKTPTSTIPNVAYYIGPQLVFVHPNQDTRYFVQIINDNDPEVFTYNHKKDWDGGSFFKSLYDSIRTFVIANAIRDLRGDLTEHRSMLVNVSRFIKVQNHIRDRIIVPYLEQLKEGLNIFGAMPSNLANKNPDIQSLFKTWEEQYKNKEIYQGKSCSWDEILSRAYESVKNIKVICVNSKNRDQLHYDKYREKGLRVIAIGGLALSRGLTLKGLMTSYFYRNTSTYDVLMQMGRWFGYRPGYADLCRLWITQTSYEWYKDIAATITELKHDIGVMNENKQTPMDFGVRVRISSEDVGLSSYIDKLNNSRKKKTVIRLSAPNKMRNAQERTEVVDFHGLLGETRYFPTDFKTNDENIQSLQLLKMQDYKVEIDPFTKKQGIRSIPKENIIDFLKHINVSRFNYTKNLDPLQIANILNEGGIGLESVDVSFYSGDGDEIIVPFSPSVKIRRTNAKFDIFQKDSHEQILRMRGGKSRLGTKNDTNIFLTKPFPIVDLKTGSYTAKSFLKYRDKPLLIFYFVNLVKTTHPDDPDSEAEAKWIKYCEDKNHFLLGFAFAFNGEGSPQIHHYATNRGNDYFDKEHEEEFQEGEDQIK